MREPQPKAIRLKDYSPPEFRIDSVDLDVDLRDDHSRGPQEIPRVAVQRQPDGHWRRTRRAPLGALRGPLPETLVSLRHGGGRPGGARGRLPGEEAPRLRGAGQAGPGRLGDGLP